MVSGCGCRGCLHGGNLGSEEGPWVGGWPALLVGVAPSFSCKFEYVLDAFLSSWLAYS